MIDANGARNLVKLPVGSFVLDTHLSSIENMIKSIAMKGGSYLSLSRYSDDSKLLSAISKALLDLGYKVQYHQATGMPASYDMEISWY